MISFRDNTIAIESVSGPVVGTCVLRCDRRVICFGDNNHGRLGVGDGNTRGNGPNQMSLLQPIVFDPLKIGLSSTALSALTLSNGYEVPISPCQTVYILKVYDDTVDITIATIETVTVGATVTLNEGATTDIIPLSLNRVSLLRVKVSLGSLETTYLFVVRRFAASAVFAGTKHTCIIAPDKI